jgi:hypothetical protein
LGARDWGLGHFRISFSMCTEEPASRRRDLRYSCRRLVRGAVITRVVERGPTLKRTGTFGRLHT